MQFITALISFYLIRIASFACFDLVLPVIVSSPKVSRKSISLLTASSVYWTVNDGGKFNTQ